MPYIDEDVFNDQMRALLVARGGYTSEKKKEEIKRYWFLEFRSCDEAAFIQTMGKLKFAGKSGDGFPSYRDFRDEYNQLITPEDRLKGRQFCGHCVKGRVFYRDIPAGEGEVQDYVANCATCEKHSDSEIQKINPHQLHKDKLGQYRTLKALEKDRIPQEVKWPGFLEERWREKNSGEKRECDYFIGLHPLNDPDYAFNVTPQTGNGVEIAKALYGESDPKTEIKRKISLERDRKEDEGFTDVPY